MKAKLAAYWGSFKEGFTIKRVAIIAFGAIFLAFGVHNVHNQTGITEGGIVGLMLLIEHWFGISPAITTFVLDVSCYLLAIKYLGKGIIKYSVLATVCMSLTYKILEMFPHTLPDLTDYPLLAAVLGAIFVGVGAGLVVREGGSCGGDDALALTICELLPIRLSLCYLVTDITVLALSLTYIPFTRIFYSLITVTISSVLVDFVKEFKIRKPETSESSS